MSVKSPARELPPDKLAYRIDEAAEAIGMSRSKLYECIHAKKINFKKADKITLIPRAELVRYLESLPDGVTKAPA